MLGLSLKQSPQKFLAIGEVLVDQGPADAGRCGHRLHGYRVDVAAPHQLSGHVEQSVPPSG
jgi:hypothetical protein